MFVVYESKKPVFAIGRDELQWILAKSKVERADGRVDWADRTYHPYLTDILSHLAEYYYRKNAKKQGELADIQKSVAETQKLIEDVGEDLSGALLEAGRAVQEHQKGWKVLGATRSIKSR